MRSMRKHVHHAGGAQRKAVLVHEDARIAREAARMAGNVQHRPRRRERATIGSTSCAPARGGSSSTLSYGRRAQARVASRFGCARFAAKNSHVRRCRCAPRSPRARATSPASPSTPTTCAPLRASGSEKFPRPQNRSSTRSPGAGAQQLDGALDHLRIELAVHLHEVGRLKPQRHVELRQADTRAARPRVQRRDGVVAARLQVDLHAMLARELHAAARDPPRSALPARARPARPRCRRPRLRSAARDCERSAR